MRNIKLLLKLDLYSLFGINKIIHKKSRTGGIVIVLAILLACGMAGLAVFMSSAYTALFYFVLSPSEMGGEQNLQQYVPSVFFIICSLMAIFSCVKSANSRLFDGKSYEMLATLPIKTSDILIEKIIYMYVSSAIMYLIVFLPSSVVYGLMSNGGMLYFFRLFIMLPFTPMIAVILGMAIGIALSYFLKRIKKIFIQISGVLLTIGFIVVYVMFILNPFGSGVNFVNLSNAIYFYPPTFIISLPIVTGNLLMYLLGIAVSILSFVLFVMFMIKKYVHINAIVNSKTLVTNFKLEDKKSIKQSVVKTLISREYKLLFSTKGYFMNGLAGSIMIVVMSVVLLTQIVSELNGLSDDAMSGGFSIAFIKNNLSMAVPLFPLLISGLYSQLYVSISLEGKNLWILKSSPIKETDIFLAKTLSAIIIQLPILIVVAISYAIVLNTNILIVLLSILCCVSLSFMFSFYALIINLLLPSLDWETPIKVVKQSASMFVAVFGNMLLVAIFALPVVLPGFFMGVNGIILGTAILLAITTIIALILYRTLNTWGVKKFQKL